MLWDPRGFPGALVLPGLSQAGSSVVVFGFPRRRMSPLPREAAGGAAAVGQSSFVCPDTPGTRSSASLRVLTGRCGDTRGVVPTQGDVWGFAA